MTRKDIRAIKTEIRKTYSDEQDKETLKWREHLENVLEKIKSNKKLTNKERTTVMQCFSNNKIEKELYGRKKMQKVI